MKKETIKDTAKYLVLVLAVGISGNAIAQSIVFIAKNSGIETLAKLF